MEGNKFFWASVTSPSLSPSPTTLSIATRGTVNALSQIFDFANNINPKLTLPPNTSRTPDPTITSSSPRPYPTGPAPSSPASPGTDSNPFLGLINASPQQTTHRQPQQTQINHQIHPAPHTQPIGQHRNTISEMP